MILAPARTLAAPVPAPSAAPARNAAPDELTLTPGMRMPTPDGPGALLSPEQLAMRTYLGELFACMDVRSVGYNRVVHPGTLRVAFNSYDFAKLADNVLRDTVLGVKLVFLGPDGAELDMTRPAAPWASSASNAARVIAAMPGVTSYENLQGSIVYRAASVQARDELKALVEPAPNGAHAIWLLHHGPA